MKWKGLTASCKNNGELKKNNGELQKNNGELQKNNGELKNKVNKLQEAQAKAKPASKANTPDPDATRAMEKLKNDNKKLREELEKAKNPSKPADNATSAFTKKQQETIDNLTGQVANATGLKNELAKTNGELKAAQDECRRLESSISRKDAEIEQLRSATAASGVDSDTRRIKELTAEKDALVAEKTKLIEQHNAKVNGYKSELDALRKTIADQKTELMEKLRTIDRNREEIQKHKDEVEEVQDRLEKIQKATQEEHQGLKDDLEAALSKIRNHENIVAEQLRENKRLKKQVDGKTENNNRLKAKLERLTRNLTQDPIPESAQNTVDETEKQTTVSLSHDDLDADLMFAVGVDEWNFWNKEEKDDFFGQVQTFEEITGENSPDNYKEFDQETDRRLNEALKKMEDAKKKWAELEEQTIKKFEASIKETLELDGDTTVKVHMENPTSERPHADWGRMWGQPASAQRRRLAGKGGRKIIVTITKLSPKDKKRAMEVVQTADFMSNLQDKLEQSDSGIKVKEVNIISKPAKSSLINELSIALMITIGAQALVLFVCCLCCLCKKSPKVDDEEWDEERPRRPFRAGPRQPQRQPFRRSFNQRQQAPVRNSYYDEEAPREPVKPAPIPEEPKLIQILKKGKMKLSWDDMGWYNKFCGDGNPKRFLSQASKSKIGPRNANIALRVFQKLIHGVPFENHKPIVPGVKAQQKAKPQPAAEPEPVKSNLQLPKKILMHN